MAKYSAKINWKRGGTGFTDSGYHRSHVWEFDEGIKIPASASPEIIPPPLTDPAAVDPEEAFVAALSSCHMLWFLSIAARRNFIVDQYEDLAEGIMGKNNAGKLAITEVTLHPHVIYRDDSSPSIEEDTEMHNKAHEECFIANSVETEIKIESAMSETPAGK